MSTTTIKTSTTTTTISPSSTCALSLDIFQRFADEYFQNLKNNNTTTTNRATTSQNHTKNNNYYNNNFGTDCAIQQEEDDNNNNSDSFDEDWFESDSEEEEGDPEDPDDGQQHQESGSGGSCCLELDSSSGSSDSLPSDDTEYTTDPIVVLPWWYGNEDEPQLARIFQYYERQLKLLHCCYHHQLSELKDARRLAHFVGRIERRSVRASTFTTLDKIEIFRRDIRPIGSTVSLMEELHVLTVWDEECGLPAKCTLLTTQEKQYWQSQCIKHPISYLYCLPVWESKTGFKFSVACEKHSVGYADQPFHYTPYIPRHLLCFGGELL